MDERIGLEYYAKQKLYLTKILGVIMKKSLFILSLLITLSGCQLEDSVLTPNTQNKNGNLLLKFDSSAMPSNITDVVATLTRQGFGPISAKMNVIDNSTAEISFYNISVGVWHLLVEAKDEWSVVKYAGETNVNVIENSVTDVYLTLVPTNNGTGIIRIFVNWEPNTSTHWIDYFDNPILLPENSVYENKGVSQAKIYYDGNKYLMWYVGVANGFAYTLYAESLDGINWMRPISQPVLSPGIPGSWDSRAVAPGPVIKDGNTYKMYYLGYSDPEGQFQIGLATSSDGKVWQKYSTPVLVGSSYWERQISPHAILKIDSLYYLYYIGRSNVNQDKIGLALSNDGITWLKYSENPVLVATQIWEGTGISWPSIVHENGTFSMVYMSTSYGANAFGMATSYDGKNWTKLSTNPIFKASYTSNRWAGSDVSYPYFLKVDNKYRIYYSGRNNEIYKIGFAELNQ